MPLVVVAALLGLIQGLGEFLPISSSGHLVIFQAFFGLEEPEVAFDLVLHLGTLTAVFIFYRQTLAALISELRYLPGALLRPARMLELYRSRPDFRFGILILAGTAPTAIVGLCLNDFFTAHFFSVESVAAALLITGLLLRLAGRRGQKGRAESEMTLKDAIIIGLVQGAAIIPGFSRSGFTICAAIFLGFSRVSAARYSFLLSIPAIVGGAVLEIGPNMSTLFTAKDFAAGFLAAAVCGYLALSLLLRLLKSDNFMIFSWWCWGVGLLALVYSA